MKQFLLSIMIFMQWLIAYADNNSCKSSIIGYKMVVNAHFPFSVDGKKACFFAFYTPNPEPMVDVRGNGNLGDAIWYGYYDLSNPNKIYEFPKPLDIGWSSVCSIDAISFLDVNGDKKREVTIIGSCSQNAINYTVPFVFFRQGDKYFLNKNVYENLYGKIGLTVADVIAYIKFPKTYYRILEKRGHGSD